MLSESSASVRRFLRFLALPFCYFFYVNWKECTASHFQVFKDFLYIFFHLKYFPDNYSLCRLWEIPIEEWKYYYGSVYDARQRSRLRKEVFPYNYRIIYDDKSITHQLCRANGLPVPNMHGVIDPIESKNFFGNLFKNHPNKNFIIKPVAGRGGKDIYFAYVYKGQILFKKNNSESIPLDLFTLPTRSVVQEYITQHPKLTQISASTNTVRIITMLSRTGCVIIIGAFMRFGVEKAFLDNTSQGGVTVGIDTDTGNLKKYAYDFKSMRYTEHPTSIFEFEGFPIPFWRDVVELSKKVQSSIGYNKLIGQDIAIAESGPVIIELNAEYDNVGLEQVCGPILKNRSVLKEFRNYNLLINRLQRDLIYD
jgi:hypothetical protein